MDNVEELCTCYKFMLVEELSLCNKISEIHRGYCSVIGKLVYKNKCYYLENIKHSSFARKHTLDDGDTWIRLLTTCLPDPMPVNDYVECAGEFVFWLKYPQPEDVIKSPNDRIRRAENLENNFLLSTLSGIDFEPSMENKNQEDLPMYDPSILLHSVHAIDHPRTLIRTNLDIRFIEKCVTDV